MNIRITRLRGEIASGREALTERLDRLEGLALGERADDAVLALAAWELHHAYGALESILERCARTLEGSLPEGADWHRALLDGACLTIPGLRPPLLTRELGQALHELLAFRHFVRHAYAVRLDGQRLAELRERVRRLRPALERDLDRLDAWLAEVARAS